MSATKRWEPPKAPAAIAPLRTIQADRADPIHETDILCATIGKGTPSGNQGTMQTATVEKSG